MEIDNSRYMHWYYFGCHSVEDNNNDHQGQFPFEEVFTPHCQELGQCGFIVAFYQMKRILAFNFSNNFLTEIYFSKAKFVCSIAKVFIQNKEFYDDNDV